MGVLDDEDERMHIVANDSQQDTTCSQLAYSPLSRPTTATVSKATCKQKQVFYM